MSESEGLIGVLNQYAQILAVLVVVAGWVIARLCRQALDKSLPWVNRVSLRWGAQPDSLITPTFAQGLGTLVYWGVLLTSVVLGLFLLGGGEWTQWLQALPGFVSRLLVALGILVLGHIVGLLARSVLTGMGGDTDLGVLAWIAYGLIVSIAAVTALQRIGIDLTFVTRLLLVVIGIFLSGLVLAFALGARSLVANLAAQSELSRYKPGDRLRVDGIEGAVVEIHRTGMILSTEQGQASIPASRFAETTVILNLSDGEMAGNADG